MSKKNRFYNEPETTEEKVVEEEAEEIKTDESSDVIVIDDKKTEESKDESLKIGTVNTAKLNVRINPSLTSGIQKVLSMNDKVVILDDSDALFYKIEDGFVMKDFIDV